MKRLIWVGLLAAASLPLNFTKAQDPAPSTSNNALQTARSGVVPTNVPPGVAEVIRLAESGVGDDVVVAYIQNSQVTFNLSADDVLYLRDIGLSSPAITAMLNHDRTLRNQAPPNPVPTVPVEEPPPAEMEPPPVDSGAAPPDVNYFYNDLAPYGTWVDLDGVGWCWQPRVVVMNHGWQPYCDRGHWLYSDCGWYWQSDYSWGWAPFHYGRWLMHDRCGWVWVPDTTWGPAWVIWRTSGDYCGWAPVPPHAAFDAGLGWRFNGVHVGLNFDFGLRPDRFTFVALKDFTQRDLGHRHLPATEVTRMYSHTTIVNNYTVNNRMVVNNGIPVERVSMATHAEIHKVAVSDAPAGSIRTVTSTPRMANGTAVIYRPQLHRPANPVSIVAQKVDDRHPVIQHSAIIARNSTIPNYAGPNSTFRPSRAAPGSELERRSTVPTESAPRPDRGAVNSFRTPAPQSGPGTRDQSPRYYSPAGSQRATETQPMVKPQPGQSAPESAPASPRGSDVRSRSGP